MRAAAALLVALVAALALARAAAAEDFIPHRLHLLDRATVNGTQNLMFRGNAPVSNGRFAYDELVATMKNRSAAAGVAFPEDFYLVDVSFLVSLKPSEGKTLKIEEAFFGANSSVGHFINWPLLGNLVNPNSFHHTIREGMAKRLDKWTTDKMPDKVPELRAMLMQARDKPVVVYIHCSAGVDRTGAMSANYLMRYGSQNYSQVVAFDDSVEPRPIAKPSLHSVMWYCLYLHWAENYNQLGCPSQ